MSERLTDKELLAELRSQVWALKEQIDEWKSATTLIDGAGDPDGIEPRHLAALIHRLDKSAAAWKSLAKALWTSGRQSGKHLGAVRRWMQWNVPGGDAYRWSSADPITIHTTMREMDRLAELIGAGAMRERDEARATADKYYRWYLEAASKLECAEAKAKVWEALEGWLRGGHTREWFVHNFGADGSQVKWSLMCRQSRRQMGGRSPTLTEAIKAALAEIEG